MWLRVARYWLHCTVQEAQARISSAEFGEMLALYRMEPWDGSRAELQRAVIAADIVSATAKQPIRPQAYAPFLKLPGEPEGQNEQDMRDTLEGIG
jgi:hypothetical protein